MIIRIAWWLSEKTRNTLRRNLSPGPASPWTDEQIDGWLSRASDRDILKLRGIGPKTRTEIRETQAAGLAERSAMIANDGWAEHAAMVMGQME